jgi:hypothetical protein
MFNPFVDRGFKFHDIFENASSNALARDLGEEPFDEIELRAWDTAPRYLLRNRDASYGPAFRDRLRVMDINEVVTAPRSLWQNPYVERLIGSIRRECRGEAAAELGISIRSVFRILRTRKDAEKAPVAPPGTRIRTRPQVSAYSL